MPGFLYTRNIFKKDTLKSGALVRMANGHRIPFPDTRKNAHKYEKTLPKRSPANGYPKDITGVETRPFFAQRSYRMAVSLKCPPIAESDPNLVWSPLPCALLKKGVTHDPWPLPASTDTQNRYFFKGFLITNRCFFDPWPLPVSPSTQNRYFSKGF